MSSENYKLYKKYKVEIFDMICDIIERAPVPDDLAFLFGTATIEQREEFDTWKVKHLVKEQFEDETLGSDSPAETIGSEGIKNIL